MRKKITLGLSVAICALGAFHAAADEKYPAANFEPSVIYIDKDIAAQSSASPASAKDDKYPAASFEPKVVFMSSDAGDQSGSQPAAAEQFDPKYPAAYFKPKVIFP